MGVGACHVTRAGPNDRAPPPPRSASTSRDPETAAAAAAAAAGWGRRARGKDVCLTIHPPLTAHVKEKKKKKNTTKLSLNSSVSSFTTNQKARILPQLSLESSASDQKKEKKTGWNGERTLARGPTTPSSAPRRARARDLWQARPFRPSKTHTYGDPTRRSDVGGEKL